MKLCGICRRQKQGHTYNAAKVGVHMTVIWLCKRCDLTGDKV